MGALPLQAPDPTTGNSVTGGLSVDLIQRRFSFSAPILALAGRAGLGAALALSNSSNVWTAAAGTNVFNVDRGFPAPGWRLGFGAIQIKTPTNVVYASGTTGKTVLSISSQTGCATN